MATTYTDASHLQPGDTFRPLADDDWFTVRRILHYHNRSDALLQQGGKTFPAILHPSEAVAVYTRGADR